MGFDVAPEAYGRFMGRYSEPLADRFAQTVAVPRGSRALDVGCGPGALTSRLVAALGPDAVAAVDPSPSFVAAARSRFPGVDVRAGAAEALPFPDDAFDLTAAQLVVHFMTDPVAGLREMGRVTRPGGVVAANVWDHGGGGGPLRPFWDAVHDVDPSAPTEAHLPGTREGQLAALFTGAGLRHVEPWTETVRTTYATFEEWWEPFTLGVGPAGAYVSRLDGHRRDVLRSRCAEVLPRAPFEITAAAWCVRARVS